MKETSTPKYVTEATFKESMAAVDRRFDGLTLIVLRHESDIKEIKETMMTREMGQRIFDQVTDLAAKYEESQRAVKIHLAQLMDFRPQIDNHEKRIVALENRS